MICLFLQTIALRNGIGPKRSDGCLMTLFPNLASALNFCRNEPVWSDGDAIHGSKVNTTSPSQRSSEPGRHFSFSFRSPVALG